jgi:hypothetical protein
MRLIDVAFFSFEQQAMILRVALSAVCAIACLVAIPFFLVVPQQVPELARGDFPAAACGCSLSM